MRKIIPKLSLYPYLSGALLKILTEKNLQNVASCLSALAQNEAKPENSTQKSKK